MGHKVAFVPLVHCAKRNLQFRLEHPSRPVRPFVVQDL